MCAPYSPQMYHETGNGEVVEGENLVEFHLLYSGPLHSGGSEHPRKEKHIIRKVFHSQLRHLWETQPYLREMAVGMGGQVRATGVDPAQLSKESFEHGVQTMGKNWNRSNFNFLPLVTKNVCLRCRLDILFLRVEESPFVFTGSGGNAGDIDARLKILFDAMRMIDNSSELPNGVRPEEGEDPFFVLLQDDKLISEVNINTDRLLKLPENRPLDKHDVYLQIRVRLNPTIKSSYSWVFE